MNSTKKEDINEILRWICSYKTGLKIKCRPGWIVFPMQKKTYNIIIWKANDQTIHLINFQIGFLLLGKQSKEGTKWHATVVYAVLHIRVISTNK